MINVLFVCYGNICRSPMAEFLFKNMVDDSLFNVWSGATSSEEIGSPVYYAVKEILDRLNISCKGFSAHRITREECKKADYILVMEERNAQAVKKIAAPADHGKVFRLLDFTDRPADIADPWYTRDFELTYSEITLGLNAFLKYLGKRR